MDKFINDIKTFFFNLPTLTKIVIIAGLSFCFAMLFIKFIKYLFYSQKNMKGRIIDMPLSYQKNNEKLEAEGQRHPFWWYYNGDNSKYKRGNRGTILKELER